MDNSFLYRGGREFHTSSRQRECMWVFGGLSVLKFSIPYSKSTHLIFMGFYQTMKLALGRYCWYSAPPEVTLMPSVCLDEEQWNLRGNWSIMFGPGISLWVATIEFHKISIRAQRAASSRVAKVSSVQYLLAWDRWLTWLPWILPEFWEACHAPT